MYNIFFCSDHHFGHSKLYDTFTTEDGKYARHEFVNSDEGDAVMIERHNKIVKPEDRVYFIGDLVFHKKHLYKVGLMTGRKVLIKGNHDLLDIGDYLQYFDDVRGVHQFKGAVITHIPVHPECLGKWGFNIHGHLHTNKLKDDRYFNASMECINYTPIALEEVMKFKPKES